MKLSEIIVKENFVLRALGIGNKAAKPVAGAVDDVAVRAAQDAKLKTMGRAGINAPHAFKAGDIVNVNLRAYKKQQHFSTSANVPFKNTDSEIAKVIEIIPHPVSPGSFLAKLETIPGKVRQEPVYYKGQIVSWKDIAPEATKFTMPLEFLSKRP